MASLLAPLLVLFIAQARFLVAERGRFLPSRRLRLLPGPASGPADSVRSTATGRRTPSPTSRSEEHTSELQSLMRISYAVFCLKKKTQRQKKRNNPTLII